MKIPKIESNCTGKSLECKGSYIIEVQANIFDDSKWIAKVWMPIRDNFGYFIHRVPKVLAMNVSRKQAKKLWKKMYMEYAA